MSANGGGRGGRRLPGRGGGAPGLGAGGGGGRRGGGCGGGLGDGGDAGVGAESGAAGGGVAPSGADGGVAPAPPSPPTPPPPPGVCPSSFCASHIPSSSKSPQQSPTARQSRSQQHDVRHRPHTPSQLSSPASLLNADAADATRADLATPSSSRRRSPYPTAAPGSVPAVGARKAPIVGVGAFSPTSPRARRRPAGAPPGPPRATDHARTNTVRMTMAAAPTRRRRVRPAHIRVHGRSGADFRNGLE